MRERLNKNQLSKQKLNNFKTNPKMYIQMKAKLSLKKLGLFSENEPGLLSS